VTLATFMLDPRSCLGQIHAASAAAAKRTKAETFMMFDQQYSKGKLVRFPNIQLSL
jgi:hypothetical protein